MIIIDYLVDSSLKQKIYFLGWFFVIFTFTYGIFYAFDWLPETPTETDNDQFIETNTAKNNIDDEAVDVVISEYPREISIPSLNRNVAILNTASSEVADLDADLLKGVVRHPASAKLGEEGNVFLLGHSSYLPKVFNKNFQAFNGLQNLVWGDTIVVKSDTMEYIYQVKKVYKAKASALTIPIAVEGKRLTLSTCNSFGTVDDRFIVEAELVDTRLI